MPSRGSWVLCSLLLIGAAVFLPGINWGLPSREADPFLFGAHPVWNGQQILKLAGTTEDANRGADVASHSSADRQSVVVVNATDEERARIVRRFRLMSYQPDEWNTLKALSEMKPGRGNFDPKLYQYGGLWVYPVGAMLKVAAMLHLVELHSDVTWYLDHPEAFGRFYVVARCWSVVWAMVGIVAIYALVRRIVGGWIFPAVASLCFIFMPVVVNMAHEAKPHLAGAVLMLLSVLAAARYVERGTRSTWVMAGALCGAALGMVLSTLPVFLILLVMVTMRRSTWREKWIVCAGAVAIGVGLYLLSNPYVPINFLLHRAVLESNLGNSKAMYHAQITPGGIANATYLIAAGTSPLLAIAGSCGAILLGIRAVRVRDNLDMDEVRRRATGLLLAIPALCVLGQCIFFATDKPGEFGRFMLLGDIFLMVEAVVAIATFLRPTSGRARSRRRISPLSPVPRGEGGGEGPFSRAAQLDKPPFTPTLSPEYGGEGAGSIAAVALIVMTAIPGLFYVRTFVRDSQSPTPRLIVAEHLRMLNPGGKISLAIYADPAPYCLPPVDLFDGKILLLPKDAGPSEGVSIAPVSVQAVDARDGKTSFIWKLIRAEISTPISWADKPFEVRRDR